MLVQFIQWKLLLKLGKKVIIFDLKINKQKIFFHKNNYKRFEVTGFMGDQKEWPPSFIVKEYTLLD